ncbi:hypothetical protein B0H14DRAFT_2576351 [Mycena olivaceomarginata]|nr:hypothetical protein B0H14DRAFT_2576351 [Mycena olivaceomarginata]
MPSANGLLRSPVENGYLDKGIREGRPESRGQQRRQNSCRQWFPASVRFAIIAVMTMAVMQSYHRLDSPRRAQDLPRPRRDPVPPQGHHALETRTYPYLRRHKPGQDSGGTRYEPQARDLAWSAPSATLSECDSVWDPKQLVAAIATRLSSRRYLVVPTLKYEYI